MIDTREQEIGHLIGRLDRLIAKEQAIVRVLQDDPDQATVIHANQLGYLRLGIEFQKAALAPVEDGKAEVDLAYLLGQDAICWEFRRREDGLPLPEPQRTGEGGFGALIVGIAIMGFFFASCVTGAPIVASTIFGFLSGSP
jgi:hypothetical protein